MSPSCRGAAFAVNVLNVNHQNSVATDSICTNNLQRDFDVLKTFLLFIVNGILKGGLVFEGLKITEVMLLLKGRSYGPIEYFPPISILPALDFVLEKDIIIAMTAFL